MKHTQLLGIALVAMSLSFGLAKADNPLVTDQFTADPTARVFNGKIYVYPSHDIPAPPNTVARKDWFVMEDYHVFSSQNLVDWTDHGVIVNHNDIPWAAKDYTMWAPDCVEKNGKYYFYFPVNKKPVNGGRGGGAIGVGIADKPEGPYTFEPKPIDGAGGIDPCVFIDKKDGQAYIYWARGALSVAKLKDNMVELASEPVVIQNLPNNGMKEGPFVFERNGKYYLTYPNVQSKKTELLAYCMGDSPMGPFTYKGVIMDESPTGCWTNHHSILDYNGQWYLFYHHNDYSPKFDKNRSIRADSLFFEADGTIRKVIPTWRGVGLTPSTNTIQVDRYTAISPNGTSVVYNDTAKTFAGWKTLLGSAGAWIQYNSVKFDGAAKKVQAKVSSTTGGVLQIRVDKVDGPVLASVKVPKGAWQTVEASVKSIKAGNHNLFVSLQGNATVEVDWVSFK